MLKPPSYLRHSLGLTKLYEVWMTSVTFPTYRKVNLLSTSELKYVENTSFAKSSVGWDFFFLFPFFFVSPFFLFPLFFCSPFFSFSTTHAFLKHRNAIKVESECVLEIDLF